MADFLQEMPKAELHLHLEGAVEPETLHELDPKTPVEKFRALYRYPNFDAFLQAFGAIGKRLRCPADYALAVRRLLERLESQNVTYAEITLAAGVVLWKRQEFAPVFDAVAEAAAGSPVQVRWILDSVRQFGVEAAMQVAELAAERLDRGVVAFGIGGSEERGPAEWFTGVFSFARSAGLRLTAHAGESELLDWVRSFIDGRRAGGPGVPRTVFLVHGEPEAQAALEPKVRSLGFETMVPRWHQTVTLD
jgi:adenosine deaminase/aminodeoxyfutalosine deaminase